MEGPRSPGPSCMHPDEQSRGRQAAASPVLLSLLAAVRPPPAPESRSLLHPPSPGDHPTPSPPEPHAQGHAPPKRHMVPPDRSRPHTLPPLPAPQTWLRHRGCTRSGPAAWPLQCEMRRICLNPHHVPTPTLPPGRDWLLPTGRASSDLSPLPLGIHLPHPSETPHAHPWNGRHQGPAPLFILHHRGIITPPPTRTHPLHPTHRATPPLMRHMVPRDRSRPHTHPPLPAPLTDRTPSIKLLPSQGPPTDVPPLRIESRRLGQRHPLTAMTPLTLSQILVPWVALFVEVCGPPKAPSSRFRS